MNTPDYGKIAKDAYRASDNASQSESNERAMFETFARSQGWELRRLPDGCYCRTTQLAWLGWCAKDSALRQRLEELEKELHKVNMECANAYGDRNTAQNENGILRAALSLKPTEKVVPSQRLTYGSLLVEEMGMRKRVFGTDNEGRAPHLPWRRPDEVPKPEECDYRGWVYLLNQDCNGIYATSGEPGQYCIAWHPVQPFPSWVTEKKDGFREWLQETGFDLTDWPSSKMTVLRAAYEAGQQHEI